MLGRFRHLFAVLFFLLVASCSGGGCGGCGGCAGMTPLPGGFPADKAVENAASVRISRQGLDLVEKELGPVAASLMNARNGTVSLEIPETPFEVQDAFTIGFCPLCIQPDVKGSFCPGGPNAEANPPRCVASANIGSAQFQIDAVKPNAITVKAVIPLKLDDTPVSITDPVSATVHVGYGANATCNNEKPVVQAKQLPVTVTIPIVAETTAPRTGYSKIDVDAASIDLSAIQPGDIRLCATCGALPDNWCETLLNWSFIKDRVVNSLKGGLEGQVKNLLRDQLCTKPNPTLVPSCPTGSSPDGSGKYCVYDTAKDKCVPMLLGTDAHIELGGLLASISPGTEGGLDFALASFGAMQPAPGLDPNGQGRTANGITLGMVGGVLPQPPSKCVVQKPVTPPTGIPIPDELLPTAAEPQGTPHVGIALSGRFLDYAFTSVYNSGLLCLGVSTEQFDMLKTGLLSFVVPSMKTLTFEQEDAAAAIVVRPQEPPAVTIGGGTDPNADPLLLVTIPKLSLDFYVWSFDRFARVFTYTADLTVPATLQTAKGPGGANTGIVPSLGEIKIANGSVSNADVLLMDDPKIVAGAVSGIFGTVSKQLVGSGFSPIDIGSSVDSLGLQLQVDEIRKLTKGSDDFVGVFATLAKKESAATVEVDTRARLVDKRVWPEHMQPSTYRRDKLPELEVELSSSLDDKKHLVEYSWWIDNGTRSPWATAERLGMTDARTIVIKDDQLFLQGRHVLRVAARLVGAPETEDATPAEIPYVIDTLAPFVRVAEEAGAVRVEAWDLVSAKESLVARYRFDDGDWTDWRPASELSRIDASGAATIEVEVRDEEGNVGTVRQALIRGRADPTIVAAGSGCGCTTPGTDGGRGGLLALAATLGALALVALRRRGGAVGGSRATTRAGIALGAIGAVAATSQGCSCGSEGEPPNSGCGADCNQECLTGLAIGQPGAYLSVAKAKDGTIWAAGYNDALLSEGDSYLWGDLVVGKYDLGKQEVDWETVDGIPERTDGTCPVFEPHGWRRGETDSGDNVGRWASIQLSTNDQPMVSYYDDTHNRLKFAVNDGGGWKVFVLREQPGADIGKYSKMVLVDGKPAVAFMQLEPGDNGRTRSKIVLARSKKELPQGPEDFAFEDVAVDDDGPCRADSCGPGEACIKETGACMKTVGGCPESCGDSAACVTKDDKAQCLAKMGSVETYPRGLGAYISMAVAPNGRLGIVAYDGYHGNLLAFVDDGSVPWQRVILDGETGNRADKTAIDTGDVGIAASLAIDSSGTWHVSYVNGIDESLRYVSFADGKPGRPEIVDDGSSVDGKPHPDGKHLVGDDSAIRVDGDVITIFYSDSTSLGLRRATGTRKPSSSGHEWELRSIDQPNKWVAFPAIVPDDDRIAVWWRQTTRSSKTVEGNVLVLSP